MFDLEYYRLKNRKISNTYYNNALDKIKERDLTEASILLKKSIIYDKNNIDSRNLLGLIFYEYGEIVESLVQWMQSKEIEKSGGNIAREYINRVQKDNQTLQKFSAAIKLYNNSIDDIKNDRIDLALLQLLKAIELNDHHMKSLILISLIYLKNNDYIKAGGYLLKAQNIDRGNFTVNKLMNWTLKHTKKGEVREKQLKNVYSIKKLEDDDGITMGRYIKLTSNQKTFFVIAGLIVGLMSYHTIAMPILRRSITNNADNRVVEYADVVSDQNKIIRDQNIELEQLRTENSEANVKLKAYEEQNRLFTSQYEALNEIITLFDSGYISKAATEYVNLDKESITDETLIDLLNSAKSKIEGLGAKRLTELGTDSWNGGSKNQAINYYNLSLSINPNDPETMFLLARLYQSMNRNIDANPLFDKIIAEHPDSNYAKRSREARGY